jgi:hypothetical protein
MISVRKVTNGYIVTEYDETDRPIESVYPETIEGAVELLYHILEETHGMGSRYDAERVRIRVEPGDKYELGEDC